MHEAQKDTQRAIAAGKLIIDGRDPVADYGSILVTLEGLVALLLLSLMENNHQKAAAMLNEGLVPGVEERLSLAAKREQS